MSSPAKRRKLDSGDKKSSIPSRGLEYFFSKQRQGNSSLSAEVAPTAAPSTTAQSDEDFARKLQAEFDREALQLSQNSNSVAFQRPSNDGTHDEGPSRPSIDQSNEEVKSSPKKVANTLRLQASGITEDIVSSTIPLDESPFTFEPAKYLPQLQESWAGQGGEASYALLTRCFVLVNATSSRIKIVDTLVNCVRLIIEGDPSSLLPAVCYLSLPLTICV